MNLPKHMQLRRSDTLTQLMRMPSAAHSHARYAVSWSSAALVMAYMLPLCTASGPPATEPIMTTLELPAAFSSGCASCVGARMHVHACAISACTAEAHGSMHAVALWPGRDGTTSNLGELEGRGEIGVHDILIVGGGVLQCVQPDVGPHIVHCTKQIVPEFHLLQHLSPNIHMGSQSSA